MSRLSRLKSDNPYRFLTTNTHLRRPILIDNAHLIHIAARRLREQANFDTIAWCILPTHLHAVVRLGSLTSSELMQRFKLSFSIRYRRTNRVAGYVWQKRFWDQVIRNEAELHAYIDYIHRNPVKHGLATKPEDWRQSSFRAYLQRGMYTPGWGRVDD